jgi:hypothetical protein
MRGRERPARRRASWLAPAIGLALLLPAGILPTTALGDGMRAPGAQAALRPPLERRQPVVAHAAAEPSGVGTGLLLRLLGFYRNTVSAVDGDRCSMAPTCSLYSRQALQRHGALLGVLLTAERLLHEADEIPLVPTVEIRGETFYRDPLEANTYWWRGSAP